MRWKNDYGKIPDKTFQSDTDDRWWEANPGYWQWEWTTEEEYKQCFIIKICRNWWVAIWGRRSGNN